MIIDSDMLISFGACYNERNRFIQKFPNGLDVSGLWGNSSDRRKTWQEVLGFRIIRKNLSWAIHNGLIPCRIVGNFDSFDLSYSDFGNALFDEVSLVRANLFASRLYRTSFSYSNLSHSDLNGIITTNASFDSANLEYASARKSSFLRTSFNHAGLSNVDFGSSWLADCDLEDAIIDGANFEKAHLSRVKMP